MHALTLYHLNGCAFCQSVRNLAAELGIELRLMDIATDLEAHRHLVRELGRGTVPVLRVRAEHCDQLISGSTAIAAFLRERASYRKPAA